MGWLKCEMILKQILETHRNKINLKKEKLNRCFGENQEKAKKTTIYSRLSEYSGKMSPNKS